MTKSFGCFADKHLPTWKNATIQLANKRTKDYFNKINKMAYHDLTKTIKTPENIGELLGLGLKFCIQSRRPEKT